MHNFLAIDAGGTSTRAVLLDSSGQCLGYGTAGGGNPVSRGFDPALACLLEASQKAIGDALKPIAQVLIAMAGASLELPMHLFHGGFAGLGLTGKVMIESDLLATFYSGTYHDDGVALIAGTGAVGARIMAGRLVTVADGTGWLLGDKGSGFWLGREVARAVASALDGRGPATALTGLVLAELEIPLDVDDRVQGRLRAQQQLIAKVYERTAIEISRFAPLVFQAQDDAVARDIIERAADGLAQTLMAVSRDSGAGRDGAGTVGGGPARQAAGAGLDAAARPLVFGGSVLTKGGTVASAVLARLASAGTPANPGIPRTPGGTSPDPAARVPEGPTPILVEDGVVGAAVMVLKRSGIEVEEAVLARIQKSLAALRGGN